MVKQSLQFFSEIVLLSRFPSRFRLDPRVPIWWFLDGNRHWILGFFSAHRRILVRIDLLESFSFQVTEVTPLRKGNDSLGTASDRPHQFRSLEWSLSTSMEFMRAIHFCTSLSGFPLHGCESCTEFRNCWHLLDHLCSMLQHDLHPYPWSPKSLSCWHRDPRRNVNNWKCPSFLPASSV